MTFGFTRRTALLGGASAMASSVSFASSMAADVYPSRPVHVSIGFPAGSGADILCRYFAHALEEKAKQPFILENRPGATGNIALRFIARAEPDGYNILMTAN